MNRIIWLFTVLIALVASAAPVANAAPFVNVSPAVAAPGTTFVFFVDGYAANEPFSIWLNAPDRRVLPATANDIQRATSSGAASFAWTSPTDGVTGVWQMVVHGQRGGREVVVPFTLHVAAPTAPSADTSVTPTGGAAGALFRFYANGFTPGEVVDAAVAGPGGPLAKPRLTLNGPASAAGRLDGSWVTPDVAVAGTWQIYLRGLTSGVNRAIRVQISAAPTPTAPQLTLSPGVVGRGRLLLASATGLAADEELSVWLNTPDGRVVDAQITPIPQAGPSGNAGWGWNVPADAIAGRWQMVAHGRSSGREVVANFTVQ